MSLASRFDGAAGRAAYLGASLAVFFWRHPVILAVLPTHGVALGAVPWWFWFNPLRALVSLTLSDAGDPSWIPTLGMMATLAADTGLVVLAFQRSKRLAGGSLIAPLVIVPQLQLCVIGWLALAPEWQGEADDAVDRAARPGARTAVTGVLLGVGLIVGTVALSTLVFHLYGDVLFLVSPFLIATIVGYLANRDGKVG